MKVLRFIGVLAAFAVVATLPVCAAARSAGNTDEVLFRGNLYCIGLEDCRAFAFWGNTPGGYVEFLDGSGKTSGYIWVDLSGLLWFEARNASGGFGALPPANLPFLGSLAVNGQLQEVDQFFPAGATRPLFVQIGSSVRN